MNFFWFVSITYLIKSFSYNLSHIYIYLFIVCIKLVKRSKNNVSELKYKLFECRKKYVIKCI